MALKIFNTLTKTKEEFKPLEKDKVRFYQCGPTVYWTQHIGNIRAAVMADIIYRTLKYLDYNVDFVRNYTDVGHMTSDGDEGEDKMEKSAKKEGVSPKEIANKVIKTFENDIKKVNTLYPTHQLRATDHIQEIIEMVEILIEKDFAYQTDLGIYFDISKAKDYTRLSGQKIEENIGGAGQGEIADPQKKNPADFALWFFKAGKHANALQTWESPWGEGFPGWHIECSAMSKKYLGNTIDIHMGGIEHIPVHHTNEIAQSESANGEDFVKYWIHNEHLSVNNNKMSKSEGTGYSLAEVEEKGFDPLALRYFFLQAHYRSKQNFTWEALEASQKGLNHLYEQVASLGDVIGKKNPDFESKFKDEINNDFNVSGALAIVSELLKSDLSDEDKLATILNFDQVLGLELNNAKEKTLKETQPDELPENIQNLIKEREIARNENDYEKSDALRDQLLKLGYEIKDTSEGFKIFKI